MSEIQLCEVCREKTSHRLLFQKKGYPIFQCNSCGLVSTPSPGTEALNALYSKGYFEGEHDDGYVNYGKSETVIRREFRSIVNKIRSVKKNGRLLEIGSAYGFFLLEAKDFYDAEGIDVSGDAVQEARKKGLRVHHGDLLQTKLSAAPYDVVVMLDSIEHLEHPRETMEKVFSLLAPGGILCVTTGDVDSIIGRTMGRRWRLMTPPQHLFYFSQKTLGKMLRSIGFGEVSFSYPWKTVPLGLICYQFLRRVGLPCPSWNWLISTGIPVNLFDAMTVIARKAI